MYNEMFRKLNFPEVLEFIKWTENIYKPNDEIKSIWHPVARLACELVNANESVIKGVKIKIIVEEEE